MMAIPKQGGIVGRVKQSLGCHKSHTSKDVKLDSEYRPIKCVFVGDGTVGKGTLLRRFTEGKYIDIHDATVFDNFLANVRVDGKHLLLALWDTSGIEDYDEIRPLSYPQTDVLLICYSVDNHSALENVLSKWYPEVRHHCPNLPIVLLANKTNFRNDAEAIARLSRKGLAPLTYKQGLKMQKKIGAVAYAECSALTNEGVNTLFEEVIPSAAMSAVKKQKGGR
ncbi:Ras-related C3 botulinum toxin substrate 1 [Holothuria leucospilota]|uniref:Ras-related C3 botulinum toxin substrate 1 n=1 Tax=Holothuria leucospilota TaxID=206669 RepID=A0A9Q1C5K8_HOLLE|nr:Ras-related C3 botulinum toxin substrate 1 [Holothuria leucospilota]